MTTNLQNLRARRLEDILPRFDVQLSAPAIRNPLPCKSWDTFKAFNAGREARALNEADFCNND